MRELFLAAYPHKAEFYDRWMRHYAAQKWDEAIAKVMETDVIRIPENPYRKS